jgi:tetratricopeptide (TPR) repeat protein
MHFLLVSAMMGGDGATALAAADKLGRVVSDEVAREVGWVQAIKTAPYLAHARFSDPATVLALPEPPAGFPLVRASWRYARAVAHVARGEAGAAPAEGRELAAIARAADFAGLAAWGVPAADVVAIAREVASGRLARAEGRHEEAAAAFARAVAVEDRLPYMEPPFWYYPARRSLAAAQLAAGRAGDAVRTFREGLARAPNDAYALFGLAAALRRAGMAAAEAAAEARFREAWSGQGSPDLGTL